MSNDTFTGRLHPGCCINGVSKKAISRHFISDDSSNNFPCKKGEQDYNKRIGMPIWINIMKYFTEMQPTWMITIFTYHLSTNRHRQKSILTKIIQLWFSMVFVKQWWRLTVSCWGRIVIRILILIHGMDCILKLLIHSNIKRVVI